MEKSRRAMKQEEAIFQKAKSSPFPDDQNCLLTPGSSSLLTAGKTWDLFPDRKAKLVTAELSHRGAQRDTTEISSTLPGIFGGTKKAYKPREGVIPS
ncbi:hypothetical protein DV515_00001814 [Chloebia gouldiae]|uniref:Uncharacterized protein n=1 Tax=Chloebia gouldiae TaxID=44316 RepID=A0A3L8T378_CHLGU|nr:hypothetical protein DV515_00001814 [Chloebia gouldiae]